MTKIYTAEEVANAPGKRLVLARGDRLTPLARDRAKELGVELVVGDASVPAQALAAKKPVPAPPAQGVAALPSVRGPGIAGPELGLPPSGALYRRNALGPSRHAAVPRRGGRPKGAVVGAGHVGAMTALRLAESDLFEDLVLIDVVSGLAAGLALDISHSAALNGFSTRIAGGDDLALLDRADYVVVTAGKPRQPGMSRTDLTAVNAAIVGSICDAIRVRASDSTVVVVTNPLEEMTHIAAARTGFPDARVIGMAGVLDSARFCSLVGLTGRATPQEVRALALGSHGHEMVIPLSQAFVGDRPLESLLDASTLRAIVERTRDSGGEVVKLLQSGSAYFSPAESAAMMVRAMVWDDRTMIAACVRSYGAYGTRDTRVGLPVRLGQRGVSEIVELPLRPDERQALQEAAGRIAARIDELGKLATA
ncbi:MAG: malate dehydrogenase [Burkholderiaceae bacterium]|nr:malate dehydrogenase [Burkholderiaceae bacterium]